MEEFQTPLLRFAGSILQDVTAAEDVVQETFLRYIHKAPEFGSDGALKGWLFTVCRNLAYDNLRMETSQQKRREKAPLPEEGPTPSQISELGEQVAFLRQALANLPGKEREALRLKVHEGMNYAQIGEVLGITRGTVGWLVHRAMKRLTQRMQSVQSY